MKLTWWSIGLAAAVVASVFMLILPDYVSVLLAVALVLWVAVNRHRDRQRREEQTRRQAMDGWKEGT